MYTHTMSQFDHLMRQKTTDTRIAVVGASNDPSKYGCIIVGDLLSHGYTVLPVNPREQTIVGLPAAGAVGELAGPVHIVNVVTPPAVTARVLRECAAAGLTDVWLQPGSFDESTLAEADTLTTPDGRSLNVESDACIMVVARLVR